MSLKREEDPNCIQSNPGPVCHWSALVSEDRPGPEPQEVTVAVQHIRESHSKQNNILGILHVSYIRIMAFCDFFDLLISHLHIVKLVG